jgi:hypothetical protein
MSLKYNEDDQLQVDKPTAVQCRYEEADTLIAFHASLIVTRNVLVRSTDACVLIIMLGLAGRSETINILFEYGSGNHRRFIDPFSTSVYLGAEAGWAQ